jgi:hypothetical protein
MSLLDDVPNMQEPYRGGKTAGSMFAEVMRFFVHSLIPVIFIAVFFLSTAAMQIAVPYPELVSAAIAFFIPALLGAVIAMTWKDPTATYVWIMGLLWFSIIAVVVLDMPTGPGLCEHCGAGQKLWLTFFDITQDSGLMNNNGRLVGTWPTLALVGYALGARMVLKDKMRQTEDEANY